MTPEDGLILRNGPLGVGGRRTLIVFQVKEQATCTEALAAEALTVGMLLYPGQNYERGFIYNTAR